MIYLGFFFFLNQEAKNNLTVNELKYCKFLIMCNFGESPSLPFVTRHNTTSKYFSTTTEPITVAWHNFMHDYYHVTVQMMN